ncbi:MAG: VPLPA-CTERM sorting domain-containing protein [Gammaproteobacteria bacterium]|nr:VPLPA-CTERM sorting domain-containing protein [Gammaproteobacteria bacterium]
MVRHTRSVIFGAVLLLVASATANAAIIGTLTFRDPTGTVNSNEAIDVWVTLTLDSASDPLVYDNTIDSFGGINPATFPATGRLQVPPWSTVAFDSYNYVGEWISRSCNDSFAAPGCGGPTSAYQWDVPPPPNGWFDWSGTLNPGQSIDILLYQLSPIGGNAPAGTYQAFNVGLGLTVYGYNDTYEGNVEAELVSFETGCSPGGCSFTRTVVAAVPVPGALWLLGSGVAALGLIRRRAA